VEALIPQLLAYTEPFLVGLFAMFLIVSVGWLIKENDETTSPESIAPTNEPRGNNSSVSTGWVTLTGIALVGVIGTLIEGTSYLVAENFHALEIEQAWRDAPVGLKAQQVCPILTESNTHDQLGEIMRQIEGITLAAPPDKKGGHSYSAERLVSMSHISRGVAACGFLMTIFSGAAVISKAKRTVSKRQQRPLSAYILVLSLGPLALFGGIYSWKGQERAFHRNARHDVLAAFFNGTAPPALIALCCKADVEARGIAPRPEHGDSRFCREALKLSRRKMKSLQPIDSEPDQRHK